MAQDPHQAPLPPDETPRPSGGSSSGSSSGNSGGARGVPSPLLLLLFIAMILLVVALFRSANPAISEVGYSDFRNLIREGAVEEVRMTDSIVFGKFDENKPIPIDPDKLREWNRKHEAAARDGKPPEKADDKEKDKLRFASREFVVKLPTYLAVDKAEPTLGDDLRKHNVTVKAELQTDFLNTLLLVLGMVMLVVMLGFMWSMFRRVRDQVGGGGILGNFNRSPARRYETDKDAVTFADVAGLDNVKAELEEIVEFLKTPEKFQRLGGRIPKGTLLMGPPGTGKTLLAKAIAGEAGVPFFAINGSEFIQMFVGVGASRVRDLFRTAKDSAPCIVFVDEIDAVGRVRGAGFGGGHDEREQTLNQILSEMDGFTPTEAVIVIAATNRPDVLDPALLRPGRFDRHVTVDRPTLKGRLELLKVHTRKVPLASDVDLERIARGSVGMTGAAIRNLVNEAALWAARKNRSEVSMADFEYAHDKVLMGPRREEVLQGREKEMTAYHEVGHGLVAWLLPAANRVHKITIIPHGRALGVTQTVPDEDRLSLTSDQAYAMLAYALGGRAAEQIIYDEFNAGASSDLQRSTDIARRMVTQWGMSARLGPVYYSNREEHPFLGKEITEQRDYSEATARLIDEEVSRILNEASEQALSLLRTHRDELETLTRALIAQETLEEKDIERLIGPAARRKFAVKEVTLDGSTPPPVPDAPTKPDEDTASGNGHRETTAEDAAPADSAGA